MANSWESSILMDRYYDKIGKAGAGIGSCPRFVTFKAGYGYVDETDSENPEVLSVPYDLEDLPEIIYEGAIEASYSTGELVCQCTIPVGGVSEPKKCSMFGLYDQDDELLAVSVTLPDWVTPSEEYQALPSINFPNHSEEA